MTLIRPMILFLYFLIYMYYVPLLVRIFRHFIEQRFSNMSKRKIGLTKVTVCAGAVDDF